MKYVKMKSLSNVTKEQLVNDLNDINKFTVSPLGVDDVYVFDIVLCDSEIDRVGDKMTDGFLEDLAKRACGLTGLIDHDWSAKSQHSRIYRSWIERKDDLCMVRARAYTLSKYTDYIDKINSGILREISVSFESEGDTCSICGAPMIDSDDGSKKCKNGHVPLHSYVIDGVNLICYNKINKLRDLLEWSLVAVPCQRGAFIKNKGLGGSIMKKSKFLFNRFVTSKGLGDDDVKALEDVIDTNDTEDISEDDVKALMNENSDLTAKVKSLEGELEALKKEREQERMTGAIEKALDGCGLIDPVLKNLLNKEIDTSKVSINTDGKIEGLDEQINELKNKYKSLFVTESDTEAAGGHSEPDGDEAGIVDIDKVDTDGDAGKIMITGKKKGLSFGVSDTNVRTKSKKKQGIYF